MYGNGFLSRGFADWREFCMAVQPHLRQVFYFGEIAPGTAELWASTGAIWRDILLAEACVTPLTGHLHIVASTVGFPVGNCRNTAGKYPLRYLVA